MTVLSLCATPEYTGPAELMLEDAETLRAAGREVRLGFDMRRAGSLRPAVEERGLPFETELDLCRQTRLLPAWRDVRLLRSFLKSGRYDTLHVRFAHDHLLAVLAMAGLDRSRLRLIRSVELLENAAKGFDAAFMFSRTDHFVVPSLEHAELLHDNHQVPRERISLLRGRVDGERFHPGTSSLRLDLGIPSSAPVVGIVSRIKPDRRHADLIESFRLASQLVPDAWLVVVGRGEGEASVREQVRAAGLEAKVRFAGYRQGDALADAYRALDVKAWLATGNDGTCRAVLEAMASGCAILGGDFGAVRDAVVDRATGWLVDPRDHDATATALVRLLENLPKTRALGAAGRERALQLYSPARRAGELVQLYERVWQQPGVGSVYR